MTCKAVQTLLSAYLDREISGGELLELRAHLHDCDDCHQEEMELRRLKSMLGGLAAPAPSADLESRLKAKVLSQRKQSANWNFRTSLGAFTAIAFGSMVATLVMLAVQGHRPIAIHPTKPNVAFDVQRDQAYAIGMDATQGAPIVSVADYAGR